jgi:hypothetical protein
LDVFCATLLRRSAPSLSLRRSRSDCGNPSCGSHTVVDCRSRRSLFRKDKRGDGGWKAAGPLGSVPQGALTSKQ